MTAEIAVMNKEAIALAADSAVTMTAEKIFTSANKLFTLSKYHPVGIMVYGSAIFMGVPWETIIKVYRDNLGKKKFSTLKEYANSFIDFLDNGNPLFPDSVQKEYLRISIHGYFDLIIKKQIKERVGLRFDEKREVTGEAIAQIVLETIKKHYELWRKSDNIPSIAKDYNSDLLHKYEKIIDEVIKEVFEKLPLSKSDLNRLKKIAASLFSKFPEGIQKGGVSGVVIAGFGEEDTFPSLESFDIEGIANNKLKYQEYISKKVDFKRSSSIIAFAQGKMVATFMEGIDPDLRGHIEGYLSGIFDKYPEIIAENIKILDDNEKRLLKGKLKGVSNKIFKDYQEHVQTYRRKNYVDPVTRVVSVLPKDELAAMAESLVNLTIFKLKVTMESETVGGPIDVAVISKGDGFIWIKRKHYFKAELNPQFLANYYKEG